ncbi:hypothetical protein ABW20_dc0100662 [Dactylellina cionopaga]|nr:hypothetical protein ABW20_dc0100662 [Dactylellina cionopaga]
MPNAASLNFPRFLLPAFPRWEPSLIKRQKPVEDVTAQPPAAASAARPSTSSSFSSSEYDSEETQDPPARHARILSHDSGCVVSDDEEDEGEDGDEDGDEDGRSYTSASESAASSTNSLEIYLDTESGYGGSNEDILTMGDNNGASSSSSVAVAQQQQQQQQQQHQLHTKPKRFWSKPRKPAVTKLPPPPKAALTTTTSYLHCSTCRTNLCFASSVISKGFTGRHGRAYLVTHLIPSNIIHGKPTSRALQTGAHTVSDISCKICGSTLGWKYIHAEERSQRYKIGKYILETGRVAKVNYWDGEIINDDGVGKGDKRSDDCGDGDEAPGKSQENVGLEGWEVGWEKLGDDDVEVDLADEAELEEMFSGSWNKERAVRRRERKKQIEDIRKKVDSNV